MDKDLVIKLKLDRSSAEASAEKFTDTQLKQIKKLLGEHEAAEKRKAVATQQSSDAQTKATGQARDELGRFTKQADQAGKSVTSSFSGLGIQMAIAQAGTQKLMELMGGLAQAIDKAAAARKRMAQAFGESRDNLAELAMVMGEKADDKFTLNSSLPKGK
ncbi:hypothetical protein [Singulisphaera acidiphila]|uniref:Uncharacterized protein n=1 Tax=Singulisphaera acidiphila (strain ATCC BAA-1392 / DSM 18658 / VKM B-2454 / MOB10) TaxID=886293 RepID=L0DQF4_SINAD|nr:hypothetical protein [Singulisphaera acidiphila]AGA31664.1 hypothetical protein Sinac_7633 [Singulisphaera acidiphila DSM 18658]